MSDEVNFLIEAGFSKEKAYVKVILLVKIEQG